MEDLDKLMVRLQAGERLPRENDDHALSGQWNTCRECKVSPDWLLIYSVDASTIRYIRCGSHSMLFGRNRG